MSVKNERCLWVVFIVGLVFFGRYFMQGLNSDAAMYAGLSRMIMDSGQWWRPKGIQMFPNFFEHPPYMFQWGALVLSVLGTSDGAARAIGGLPGAVGLLTLVFWIYHRHSWALSLSLLVVLLSFGHYTKYATTSMLEAPLSLGAIWFCIGTFEYLYRSRRQALWLGLACLGALISTASKGVVGLVFCAGLTPFVLFLSPFGIKPYDKKTFWWFLSAGFFVLLPFLFWGWFSWSEELGTSNLHLYLKDQVFRSYTTDRGKPELYSGDWPFLTYAKVILKYGWPWWWTVPLGAWWIFKKTSTTDLFLKTWTKLSLTFFAVIYIAFSTSHIRLPHYIHPTYLVLAPVGAYAFYVICSRYMNASYLVELRLRWTLGFALAFFMLFSFRGFSKTPHRGQEFYNLQTQIKDLKKDCPVVISQDDMDLYHAESFALWYLKGRKIEWVSALEFETTKKDFLSSKVWWSVGTNAVVIHPQCR